MSLPQLLYSNITSWKKITAESVYQSFEEVYLEKSKGCGTG